MNTVTHFLVSWVVAAETADSRRDRMLITLGGVAPDFDGFGYPVELLTRNTDHPLFWFSQYHHALGHNVTAACVTAAVAFCLARRKVKTALLVFAAFHLHLICDLLGGRGPDGAQWPMSYFAPFSDAWIWQWQGQWALNAWPNFAVTIGCLALTLAWARGRGYSPVEMISLRADRAVVGALRKRWPLAEAAPAASGRTDANLEIPE